MLGFQHAADVLLLEQQCLRHSRFARMHMLFLDAGGAADVGGVAALAARSIAGRYGVGWSFPNHWADLSQGGRPAAESTANIAIKALRGSVEPLDTWALAQVAKASTI